MAAALGGDGGFTHCLEQGGLGAGGGAVDFVGEDDAVEDGSGSELEFGGVAVVDGNADNVGGEEIGSALDSGKGALDGLGKCVGEDGFADTGDVFDEDVSPGEEGDDDAIDGGGVPHVDGGDVLSEGLDGIVGHGAVASKALAGRETGVWSITAG